MVARERTAGADSVDIELGGLIDVQPLARQLATEGAASELAECPFDIVALERRLRTLDLPFVDLVDELEAARAGIVERDQRLDAAVLHRQEARTAVERRQCVDDKVVVALDVDL